MRAALIWSAVAVILMLPLAQAAVSPLMAWRQPVYIAASLAGVLALGVMVLQPLWIAQVLPVRRIGLWHRWGGIALLALVLAHVAGLWLTSPPDVVDALLLRAPTWFSVWGVLALWAVVLAAGVAVLRRRLHPRRFRAVHIGAVSLAVGATVAHAALIDGTMASSGKIVLGLGVLFGLAAALWRRKAWRLLR
ncbi:ferric reductase [Sagittula sp. SSi028]|uniref:ferric reductase n=1 Tax=Sagittula sp. SSi028 TaxID=3400636 RepID=UPI003AF6C98C